MGQLSFIIIIYDQSDEIKRNKMSQNTQFATHLFRSIYVKVAKADAKQTRRSQEFIPDPSLQQLRYQIHCTSSSAHRLQPELPAKLSVERPTALVTHTCTSPFEPNSERYLSDT